ncbi:hypothetical protein [Bacillus sp. BML-BC060]|uniref:hypothetical protein n=1 Tax=Bacillus sp. BML-BC060 TaxID=2842487 RepID=UPI001C7F9BBB|nr:hypothetical protein [Bacillus sp. BML-BC060]
MELKLEKYRKHNFHNEKVVRWVSETLELETNQIEYNSDPKNTFGCDCDYPRKKGGEYYAKDENGEITEVEFMNYYNKSNSQVLVKYIPDLTEEEKEELLDLGNLRIYGCPRCQIWSLDGDNC